MKQRSQNEFRSCGDGLRFLFVEELKDILDAEHRLTKALPKIAESARSETLKATFEMHLTETENHILRLIALLEELGETVERKECQGMQGIIDEAEKTQKEMQGSGALDACLITSAQKAEHYEI